MNSFKLTLITLVAALGAMWTGLSAQTTNTPYSMYGYGILNDNATSAQRAMGGVGYAMAGGRQINAMNPASYAAIDSLTFLFDMGITATSLHSSDAGVKSNNFGGGLDYITMQFPITRWMGGSIGLVPFTNVGYSFGNEVDNGRTSRNGSGGINQLYLGLGVRPVKGFSIGANIGYLFGTTINDIYGVPDNSSSMALFERVTQVRDYNLQFGAQYTYQLNRDNRFTVGLSWTPSKSLHGHAWRVNYYNIGSSSVPADTVAYTSMKGKYTLPDLWGAGISWRWRDRLTVELDYTFQNWKDAKYAELDNENGMLSMNNRTKIALGAEYLPKLRGNYFQRITYRIGGFTSRDYIRVGANDVREYGLSCGFGLPTPSSKSVLNIGFEWRHRQAHPAPLIKENYFNFTVGINFNEVWFYKNQIR